MSGLTERIDELAGLMDEFRLSEASLRSGELHVAFHRRRAAVVTANTEPAADVAYDAVSAAASPPPAEQKPQGTPITSPMNGIYYISPSPSAPEFVKEGDTISAGQVVGLIEAMKVFNEIPATVSGTVSKILVESGQVVQPGDVLMYVG